MLTPAPSVCQAPGVSSNSYSNLIPSTLLLSDAAWLSISGEYNNSQHHHSHHHSHRHQRSSPNARLSKLFKTTQQSRHSRFQHRQNHHHHDRPSRQFVATTSSAIFGDWDIDIKVDRRTLARLKKAEEAAGEGGGRRVASATAAAAAGGGGGGRGGGAGGRASIILGPGPGIHTGASGMHPLSTLPSAFSSSVTSSPPQQASHVLKGQHQSSNSSTTDNTPSSPSSSASPTVITPPSTSSPKNNNPPSAGGPQKKTNGTKTIATTITSTTPSGSKVQDVSNALVAPSARSSFLKALGKFKNKHLQQKR